MLSRRLPLLPSRKLPWALKPRESAETSLDYDSSGRMIMRIRHDVLKGVTPEMVAWWFRNIGGTMEIGGACLDNYLVWHPHDHIRWELVSPGRDGPASAGARFRIVEAFGRSSDFYVDVTERVTRLDASGFTAVTRTLGHELSRLNHDFAAVEGGTQYTSSLTVGSAMPILGPSFNAIVRRAMFSEAMGRAWLRHNVEEVGLLEHVIAHAMASKSEKADGAPG